MSANQKATVDNTSISPDSMLSETITHPATHKKNNSPMPYPLKPREFLSRNRVPSVDLRIGLHWLGHEGRKLLAEYISTNEQESQS